MTFPLLEGLHAEMRERQRAPVGRPMMLNHELEYDPEGLDMEVVVPMANGGEQTLRQTARNPLLQPLQLRERGPDLCLK